MEERSVHSSTSDINSEEAVKTEYLPYIPRKKRICLVGSASEDPALDAAAQQFSVPVLKSETGVEYIDDTTYCTYFVLKKFEGNEYDVLHKTAHRILGPTALLQLAEKKESLPSINRPMYTQAMFGQIVVFTGFRRKEELTKLVTLIHHMGGSIRKEMGEKITHLVANCCGGKKYRYADCFNIPIMSSSWVTALWDARDDISFYSSNKDVLNAHKLKLFFGARICFYGFPEEEKNHMCEVLVQQGGEPTDIIDPNCTHVVVDESNVNSLPDIASQRARIVKAEWFWTSIQNEIAVDEDEYLFDKYLERLMSPSVSARRNSQPVNTPSSASKQRKRKRLPEVIEAAQNGTSSPASRNKRRSSLSEGFLSINSSLLDSTISPENQLLDDIPEVEVVDTETVRKTLSPRHQVFLELVQTESNYVGILSTIMTLFKEPLEDVDEKKEGLLNTTEAKIIFGNFPPIYEVHKKMLEELRFCATNWREDNSIGQIILKYSQDLLKAYPPYVNFFENTKEMLDQCDQNKPRFHAFLKVCQTKPECGRQSLKELMIKPVQRLPSISLLLNDILKHTDKKNSDHNALEQSLNSIKEVMTYINEDKRKTEGQLAMFDIFNEIDNCPPHLVSSHRSFIGKCDVQELSEGLSGRGDHLVLFLFTDTLEICKKRSKAFNSVKSPNTVNGLHTVKMSGKPYKHIKMLSLSTIKKVVDIRETDECRNVFALMVRSNQELREKLYSFTITDEEVNKTNYLRCLCRQIANTVCKADADTFLITLDSHQLEINTSDVALGTLSKAFKSLFHNFYLEYMDPYVFLLNSMCETTLHVPLPFATRTKKNIQRTFSFNKTPSKLKRAVSTMMSPFGSTTSLTPASHQLAQMRLASCNNINELGSNGSGTPSRGEMLVAPMSVQPTRKAKCSTLSMASLRRNGSDEAMQNKSDL
ncbi:protein ECT2 isoform X7 [Phymastichus coffea]|uniref:protein ECT2 isoform X7 n=1 Tax=Phymastichus coffea TaxID=108790 RepID=UPI00273CB7D9|nr:protein ECT2 isoform X7 [Phymastichus coffea]